MRVLGIDLGSERIGVAVGDTTTGVATPTDVVPRAGRRPLADRLADQVREWEAELVVVGLPRSLDGSEGPAAANARAEVQAIGRAVAVPVEFQDERLTTVTAHKSLREAGVPGRRGRKVVDAVAATVILQSWLDAHAETRR